MNLLRLVASPFVSQMLLPEKYRIKREKEKNDDKSKKFLIRDNLI